MARTSVAVSRRDGLAAALGMGIGGVIFCTLALLGLHAVLASVPWLYAALKLFGGLYLVYLGVRIWRGAREPVVVLEAAGVVNRGIGRSFVFALATQLSNPKTAVVYASIFAALLPAEPPLWVSAVLPPAIFLIEAGWYALVAVAFSAGRPRAAYLRSKLWIDRAAGAVMGALGVRLVVEATPESA